MSRAYMSFGGGVQSTALALLAINRDPRLLAATGGVLPELWIFADTGDERVATIQHVAKMGAWLEEAGFKFMTVRREESLSAHVMGKIARGEGGISLPPVYVESTRRDRSGALVSTPVFRGCTRDFKVKPLDRAAREFFGAAELRKAVRAGKAAPVVHWKGMSADEVSRLTSYTDPADAWRVAAYPLFDMRWARSRCAEYIASQVYPDGAAIPAIRSSCVFCPFHKPEEWRAIQADPEAWDRAVQLDEALRVGDAPPAGLRTWPFVLPERAPLRGARFEQAQGSLWGMDEECLGVCGV